MKNYIKPEVEYVEFVTETVASDDPMGGDTISANVTNPFG